MTARQEELDAGLVCLKNVALTHKYADPVAVDITINMGGEGGKVCRVDVMFVSASYAGVCLFQLQMPVWCAQVCRPCGRGHYHQHGR
jgi:hypothetical protein